jgi:hypothetical protein
MLTYEKFEPLASIQASVFITDEYFNSGKYLAKIYQGLGDTFDGEPSVLPLPEGAPMDIPRISISTKDKGKKIDISPIRITYHQKMISDDEKIDYNSFNLAFDYLKLLLNNTNGVVCNRIGAVIVRYLFSDRAGLDIASHFCKEAFIERPFNRPNEFHIYSHKRYDFYNRYEVNSWVKVRTGSIAINKKDSKKAIVVEQDINTLADISRESDFSFNEIDFFYSNVGNEFDNILKLYFPGK